jgi:hypothetical protein
LHLELIPAARHWTFRREHDPHARIRVHDPDRRSLASPGHVRGYGPKPVGCGKLSFVHKRSMSMRRAGAEADHGNSRSADPTPISPGPAWIDGPAMCAKGALR